MLEIQPFKACRYNPEKVDFNEVLAPPYDVISPERQKDYYNLSPYNCIRLILNKAEEGDTETSNQYTRAKNFFESWFAEDALIQDEKPGFYIYKQSFKHPETGETHERLALLARVKTEPFEKKAIIPHEKTLKGPKADRLKLIQTTKTNFSPVFGLFDDDGSIYPMIQAGAQGNSVFQITDEQGISHEFWVLDDEAQVSEIQNAMSSRKAYIADGHHRYETSLEYSQLMREQAGNPDHALDSDYTLMALVSFSDPGFLLLQTHRLLKEIPFSEEEAISRLEKCFDVEEHDAASLEEKVFGTPDSEISFGLVLKSKSYYLKLKSADQAKEIIGKDQSDAWYELNVNLFGHLILAKLWEIPEEKWESLLKFEHEAAPSIQLVEEGVVQAAFLLKAPKVDMLVRLGETAERMPQKSTYFYPKLASGVVFNHHGDVHCNKS